MRSCRTSTINTMKEAAPPYGTPAHLEDDAGLGVAKRQHLGSLLLRGGGSQKRAPLLSGSDLEPRAPLQEL